MTDTSLHATLRTIRLKSAPSGSSSGLGGCTNEVVELFLQAAEDFARATVPESVTKAFMSATMTAHQENDDARHSNRNVFQEIGCQGSGTPVQGGGGVNVRSMSIETDSGGHTIRALTDATTMPFGAQQRRTLHHVGCCHTCGQRTPNPAATFGKTALEFITACSNVKEAKK